MNNLSKVLRHEDCFETIDEARAEIARMHILAFNLRAENAELKQSAVSAQFFRDHALSTNTEFEKDYLAIWKAVKQPELTVLDSVLALKARADALEKELALLKTHVSEANAALGYGDSCNIFDVAHDVVGQLAAKTAEVERLKAAVDINDAEYTGLIKELAALRATLTHHGLTPEIDPPPSGNGPESTPLS